MTHTSGAPTPSAEPTGNGSVLVVCTGNVCRSPYLERRLRQELDRSGIVIRSAGTGALVGEGIDPGSVHELRANGAAVTDFTATQLTAEQVAEADLVLTASRDHRGAVVQLHPKALRYCFTWGDFADLVQDLSRSRLDPPAPGRTWVAHVAAAAAARRGSIAPRSKRQSDIVDPYLQGPEQFSRMARQIEEDLSPIVAILSPPRRS